MASGQKKLRLPEEVVELVLGTVISTGEVVEAYQYQEHRSADQARVQRQRDGVNLWRVAVIGLAYGEFVVTVPSLSRPQFNPQSRISFRGLVVGAGSNGHWFSADSVQEAAQ